jgi:uncharacterized membrane protein YkoI
MRLIVLLIACWTLIGVAHAQGAATPPTNCVPQREMLEIVSGKRVVTPASAIMTARREVPNADVLRANLCRSDESLIYVIVALRKDGRVVEVRIDAPSGNVKSVH